MARALKGELFQMEEILTQNGTRAATNSATAHGPSTQHSTNGTQPTGAPTNPTGALYTVPNVAEILDLALQPNGKYHGAPVGTGATQDGFVLCPEGNAFTNGGTKYTSAQVAQLAGIDPNQYEPVAIWKASRNGSQNPSNRSNPSNPKKAAAFDWKRAQTFDYTDENGALLFQVGRTGNGSAKQIRQRKPNGAGDWVYSLGDVRRVLYRLPDVLAADVVFICEGEKAADALNAALERAGLFGRHVATTNPHGALKWRDQYAGALDGKAAIILPDQDETGAAHGVAVGASLKARGQVLELKRLDLPDLPEKGDVADWLDAGGQIDELIALAQSAPQWEMPDTSNADKSFEVFTFADLAKLERPQWLIRGLLVEKTTSVLTADTGSYKSFFALDMALCIATGRPFFGHEVKRGPVVYVAAEGFYTMRDRATAWSEFHGVPLPQNFHILKAPVNVSDAVTVQRFSDHFKELAPIFTVLDTLNQCATGLNENSNEEMARFMAGMASAGAAIGAHVQAVHHNAKGSGVFRGAGAIKNNVDTHISLDRPEGDQTNTVFVRCEKQRGRPFNAFSLRGQEVTLPYYDEFGDEITSLVFEATGEAVITPKKRDYKAEQKAATHTKILQILGELQNEKPDGGKIEKPVWVKAVTDKGVCGKSQCYEALKELEDAKKWFWWKGDCRLNDAQSKEFSGNSGVSGIGKLETPEAGSLEFSGNSGVSGVSLETGNAGNAGKDSREGKPEAPKRAKKGAAAIDSEPYAARPEMPEMPEMPEIDEIRDGAL